MNTKRAPRVKMTVPHVVQIRALHDAAIEAVDAVVLIGVVAGVIGVAIKAGVVDLFLVITPSLMDH